MTKMYEEELKKDLEQLAELEASLIEAINFPKEAKLIKASIAQLRWEIANAEY